MPAEAATKSNAIEIPQISLPKGGGALRGIDEKFQVNAANGTVSFTIPLPASPNRNGFTPHLSLSYNSGTGNSLFGIGWDLGLPTIGRQTDKKLPRYQDTNQVECIAAEDSFMFSGAEGLVPFLTLEHEKWAVKQFQDVTGAFTIRQYRPRTEGEFSRIERIFHPEKGYYWKVTSRENITTFFGYSQSCRLAHPTDSEKVFSWLPEFSFDDKGSWVWYEYKAEDLLGVVNEVHEKNRFDGHALFTNKHPKRVRYGNATAYYADPSQPYAVQLPTNAPYHFELVFDYGDHSTQAPSLDDSSPWKARPDAFSSYRPGFELRTYRLCQRVLMFHTFPELNNGMPTLVRSLDFDYQLSDAQKVEISRPVELTYLLGITQQGYVRKPDQSYVSKALPRMTFDYQWLKWNTEVKTVRAESLVHAPTGIAGNYQWVDLYNEGISGILSEQAHGWFYKSNLGEDANGQVRFSPAQPVIPKPSFTGIANGVLQLQDLEANGQKQVVVTSPGAQGYFELSDEGEWQPFRAFLKTLNLDLRDPNVRMLDVDGDGKPEVLLSEQGAFWWWKNEGKIGYDAPELAVKPYDEESGPAILFADAEQRIFLADMNGDGLTDIVRIRNGEVCYWANLGYGQFSAKVTMHNAPRFNHPDQFNPAYLQLADVSGTGATDLIYLGKNKFKAYLNLSGNAWSDATEIDPLFPTEQPNKVTVTDLLGNGTACLVWSSELPAYRHAPMRYIDLMGGQKPHILVSYENGLGKKTDIIYKSSTHYYLRDKQQGTPWISKLAFPVQCVSKIVITEEVTKVRFTTEYTYHHGYYDHAEREFRGFGCVEQLDTEYFEAFEKTGAANTVPKEMHQAPVLTKTWFHTGTFLDKERLLTQFKKEYWYEEFKKRRFAANPVEYELPDATLSAAPTLGDFDLSQLSAEEWREALRACKGMTLRQETFALDVKDDTDIEQLKKQATPYSVATHTCQLQLLQRRDINKHGVFIVKEREAITYHYERDPEDPRVTHTLTLETDELGNVLESVSVVYPRVGTEEVLKDAPTDSLVIRNAKDQARKGQQKNWITFTKNDFTSDVISDRTYQLRKGWQTRTYELTGLKPQNNLFSVNELKGGFHAWSEIEYHQQAAGTIPQKRLIEHVKTKFCKDDLTAPLPDGQLAANGLSYENYQLAYTPYLLQDIFTPSPYSATFEVTETDMQAGRFFQDDTNWWIRSGIAQYRRAGETLVDVNNRFFAPIAYTDPFESKTEVFYDAYHLFIERAVDAIGNETRVLAFNFRTLSPVRMRDINDNISSVVVDELGLVKATATEGKDTNNDQTGEEGDHLNGFTEQTEGTESERIGDFFLLAQTPGVCNYTQLQSVARSLLQSASARLVYKLDQQPTVVASIVREQHTSVNPNSPLQISFEYTDGLGKVAMKKVQAEPGLAKQATLQADGTWKIEDVDTGNQLRWVGNGRTVLNNKGNPIQQYEPYFSVTPAYETAAELVESGVTPTMYYDAVGRLMQTELPNGTITKTEFNAWKQYSFDANDTVKDSIWYASRITLPDSHPEKRAAVKAALHAHTPNGVILDTLGRPTLEIDHNSFADAAGNTREEFYYTFSMLDIEGNGLSVTDARGNVVMQYRYDLLGHRVAQTSMDAGKRWMLNNVLGKPVKTWDERKHEFSFVYDALHRPTVKRVQGGDEALPLNVLYERIIYGENQPNAKGRNLRGKAAILYDTAGKVTSGRYDFKGNLLEATRTFAKDYKHTPNWDTANPDALLAGATYTFTTRTEYDALNRPVKQTTPDEKITRLFFNEAGLLEKVMLRQGSTDTEYVKNIDYDAKGQRTRIRYGNDVSTRYDYDPQTFRLMQLRSTTTGGEVLQDLTYTYDPTGNITQIEDQAIPTVFFNNQKMAGKNVYTYDALYRLMAANGREQNTHAPDFDNGDNWNDVYAMLGHNSGDPMTMRTYTQRYQYDSVGNILQMRHEAGSNGSWTRGYAYESKNNRLQRTTIGSNTYLYPHHAQHGFLTEMPHLQQMAWTFKEELQATAKQRRTDGGMPETTYYVYDGTGQRVRKVTDSQADAGTTPLKKDERLYVGNYEVYRHANGLERETLHLMDDKQRIAMLDTETEPRIILGISIGRTSPLQTIRYQMGNHLGSVSLELDENAAVISYEEYHPYGTTAYQAKSKDIKAAAKRYRYTGMERDEETGLEYHSARYYVPWLGRWCSADPSGIKAGINLLEYSYSNPINYSDTNGKEPRRGQLGNVDAVLSEVRRGDRLTHLYQQMAQEHASATGVQLSSVGSGRERQQLLAVTARRRSQEIRDASLRHPDSTSLAISIHRRYTVLAERIAVQGLGNLMNHFEADRRFVRDSSGHWVDAPDSRNVTRYVYTGRMGWIDMHHFFYFAAYAAVNGAGAARSFATTSESLQGAIGRDASAFSYEDLSSDEAGIQFWERYGLAITSGRLSIEDATREFLTNSLSATEPSEAPNFDFLPHVIRENDPPMQNTSATTPLTGQRLREAHERRFDRSSQARQQEIWEARTQIQ